MRQLFHVLMAALTLVSCSPKVTEPMVMAREVPERMDDFVWENDLVCYRAYGKALERETLSPGLDLWVKTPGKLVADKRYRDDLQNGKSYHKDWGDGKDCYKVGRTLGAGASVPVVEGRFLYPGTNWRSSEIVSCTPGKVVFVLHYPWWETEIGRISLDKKFTVISGSYFCMVEDTYHLEGVAEDFTVAAGAARHEIESEVSGNGRIAIWEAASDQGAEPEDGMLGVAVIMLDAQQTGLSEDGSHSICSRTVKSGETLTYWIGSCWSKGDIKTKEEWNDAVASFNASRWKKDASKK